jgi:23S rRNA pseudouridine1911/1915/1917 synthase
MMYSIQSHRNEPYVLDETEHYTVVYKPPFIHSVPLKKDEGGIALAPQSIPLVRFPTLLDWYGHIAPRALDLMGKKQIEGGLLHRLDYETEGLVLIAKNQSAMDALRAQQEQGLFVKEYGAISSCPGNADPLPGFPPFLQETEDCGAVPVFPISPTPQSIPLAMKSIRPSLIQSYFRPWGPGRKAVRPVVMEPGPPQHHGGRRHPYPRRGIAGDRGKPYVTEILETENLGKGLTYFRLRIKRGFRHQIRCHLAWIGKPILNDALYGGVISEEASEFSEGEIRPTTSAKGNGFFTTGKKKALSLRAEGFSFYDPETREKREYNIPAIFLLLVHRQDKR